MEEAASFRIHVVVVGATTYGAGEGMNAVGVDRAARGGAGSSPADGAGGRIGASDGVAVRGGLTGVLDMEGGAA